MDISDSHDMNFLAICGSLRQDSTNLALLTAAKNHAPSNVRIQIYERVGLLPIFSPDLERGDLPAEVERLAKLVSHADGLIISSPEYVRSIPGGLKNAIDWLVSRDELIAKPIVLLHASHRGDDMLESLRRVLTTVSTRFFPEVFERFELMSMTPQAIAKLFDEAAKQERLKKFLSSFVSSCNL